MKTLQVGDTVPNFVVTDHNGSTVDFSTYRGKKVIVFFYPKANTPGCTAESCNLRDNYKALQDEGYELLGVSADTVKRQKNFAEKYSFQYPLLADTEKEAINAFGVWGPKKFMGRTYNGIHRKTFVVDEGGKVSRVIDKVKTKDHAAQLLEGWV
ncbi:MAG: thioredoxin-dependent thiol peroxidase [Marinirhabdus sp.]